MYKKDKNYNNKKRTINCVQHRKMLRNKLGGSNLQKFPKMSIFVQFWYFKISFRHVWTKN